MKRLILLLIFIPLCSHAQNCISGTDPKSGKNIQAGITFLIDKVKNESGAITFFRDDDKVSVQFAYNFNIKTSNNSTDKLILLVKFSNGDVKRFTGNTDTRIYPTPIGISVNFVFDINQNDISYFKNNPTINFKICYQGSESKGYDTEIDGKTASNIMQSINCITPMTGHAQNCISTTEPKTGKLMKSGITRLKDTTDLGIFSFNRFDSTEFLMFQRNFILKEPLKEPRFNTDQLLLLIKFSNGTTKKYGLNWRSMVMPSPTEMMAILSVDLTDADIVYFKQNPIVLITVSTQDNETKGFDTIITADEANEIINSISCIE